MHCFFFSILITNWIYSFAFEPKYLSVCPGDLAQFDWMVLKSYLWSRMEMGISVSMKKLKYFWNLVVLKCVSRQLKTTYYFSTSWLTITCYPNRIVCWMSRSQKILRWICAWDFGKNSSQTKYVGEITFVYVSIFRQIWIRNWMEANQMDVISFLSLFELHTEIWIEIWYAIA